MKNFSKIVWGLALIVLIVLISMIGYGYYFTYDSGFRKK